MISARYFGVYNGSECGCGSNTDYIVFGGTPGTCDKACVGDSAYSCGGAESYDLYQLIDHNIGLDSSHSGKGVPNAGVKFVDNFCFGHFLNLKSRFLVNFSERILFFGLDWKKMAPFSLIQGTAVDRGQWTVDRGF